MFSPRDQGEMASCHPRGMTIYTQQKNRRLQSASIGPETTVAVTADGWNTELINQPFKSPRRQHPRPAIFQLHPAPAGPHCCKNDRRPHQRGNESVRGGGSLQAE